ncbi:MAG: riboflavin synthase [Leptospiraceae bacterium]|nr:riboflavin synthase [Leptospiraceae bacterium]MCK6379775.1 riboflavin synthase [Leptospiraceae bacterium]
MFTGIIEGVGEVIEKSKNESGIDFLVKTGLDLRDLYRGDSVSVNGVCHTIVNFSKRDKTFTFYSSFKTLEITTMGLLEKKSIVNLERALLPTSRMGGHIVQGHVDTVGKIFDSKWKDNGKVKSLWIQLSKEFAKYIVERGSICVDGISLTVVNKKKNTFEILLIPETINKTNAKFWEKGVYVNLELDILARYMENFFLNQSLWKNFLPKFFR